MHFLVIAYDHPGAPGRQRRAEVRARHLGQDTSRLAVRPVFGAAIQDDEGDVVGSMLVMEAADRAGLDRWLKREPYVVEGVWREVTVQRCQVGPAFLPLSPPQV